MRQPGDTWGQRPAAIAAAILCALVIALPLTMGQRTPYTWTASGLLLVAGAVTAALPVLWIAPARGGLPPPPRNWIGFAAVFLGLVALQAWPSETLARWFGPYPPALWQHPHFAPRHWSPHVAATLRAGAAFTGLFLAAWLARALPRRRRAWLWLAVAAAALFQALYGLFSQVVGSTEILGIWPRTIPQYAQGSFSGKNAFGAYLAMTWPMVFSLWWLRGIPGIQGLSRPGRIMGTLAGAMVIGAALFASASRLAGVAGVFGLALTLLLWRRHRGVRSGASRTLLWTGLGVLLISLWIGLAPLAQRLEQAQYGVRLDVWQRMLGDFPPAWWLTGVGLGGFEAVFKQIQPSYMAPWFGYAHNDLLQWLLETGLVGAVLLAAVVAALWRNAHLTRERIPLYAGLAAMCLVALGDFSWHIPATQIVLAVYLGALLAPARDPGRGAFHRAPTQGGTGMGRRGRIVAQFPTKHQ